MREIDDWSFAKLDDFDRHVRSQLPWYELATDAVSLIARHYIPSSHGLVYDLGSSTGNMGRALSVTLHERSTRLIAIDCVSRMVERYEGPGEVIEADLLTYDYEPCDVAILFLTLMFVPVRERSQLLEKLRLKIRSGGVIIIFDKCLPPAGYPATINARLAWNGKLKGQSNPSEIVHKEMQLAGIQRPLRIGELGEDAIEVFRFGDFAGWLLEAKH